ERLLASSSNRNPADASGQDPSPAAVQRQFAELVKIAGAANKLPVLLDLLGALTPAETRYVIKVITGDLRIGLKENTVEEAIARAFNQIGRASCRERVSMSEAAA